MYMYLSISKSIFRHSGNSPDEKKGTGSLCVKHPTGRSGKWCLSPLSGAEQQAGRRPGRSPSEGQRLVIRVPRTDNQSPWRRPSRSDSLPTWAFDDNTRTLTNADRRARASAAPSSELPRAFSTPAAARRRLAPRTAPARRPSTNGGQLRMSAPSRLRLSHKKLPLPRATRRQINAPAGHGQARGTRASNGQA